jgi:hypothetical protein
MVAELCTEQFLAETLLDDELGRFAHLKELGWGKRAEVSDGLDGGGDVAVCDVEAEGVAVEQVGDVGRLWAEEEDGSGDGHGAVDFTRMDDSDHSLAE